MDRRSVIKYCPICGMEIIIPASKGSKRKTCSAECMQQYKKADYYLKLLEGNTAGYYLKGHKTSNTGKTHFKPGQKPTEKSLKNARIIYDLKYKGKPRYDRRGENCPRWKGGITKINAAIRSSIEFKEWRTKVFERDNYTCRVCGARNGDGKSHQLQAHHIKPFFKYPELRFEVFNGQTLCINCHRKTFSVKEK